MSNEPLQAKSPLLPERHDEPDLFVCDIFHAAPKSDLASMEYPLFTLSTKPDMKEREYHQGDRWVKIAPSNIGLATVHDRDLLIYCISQLMAALKEGRPIAKTVRLNVHDVMQVTNRSTGQRGYKLFQDMLRRLQSTRIETNITQGGIETWEAFSFIDHVKTVKKPGKGECWRLRSRSRTIQDANERIEELRRR